MKTLVVFRKFKEGDVVALFPKEQHNDHLCESYQTVGQHSGADYAYCIQITKAATPNEYAGLKKELERIGYDLDVKKKYIRGGK